MYCNTSQICIRRYRVLNPFSQSPLKTLSLTRGNCRSRSSRRPVKDDEPLHRDILVSLPACETYALGEPALSPCSAHASLAEQPWNPSAVEGHLMVPKRCRKRGGQGFVGRRYFYFKNWGLPWIRWDIVQLERKQLSSSLLLPFCPGIYRITEWYYSRSTAVHFQTFLRLPPS